MKCTPGVCGFVCLVLVMTGMVADVEKCWAQAADEKEVVSTGLGLTEEAARREAYRNAVQNVIGAMVVAETIVQNNELVRDKVLSHSDGYISKAAQVASARPVEGGLVEVTMRVTVKSDRLKAKLQAENITVSSLDGAVLFEAALKQLEEQERAAATLGALLQPLPASLVRAEATTQGAEQKFTGKVAQLSLPVSISVDIQAYDQLVQKLHEVLGGMGYRRIQLSLGLSREGGLHTQGLLQKAGGEPKTSDGEPLFLLGICEVIQPEASTSRWSLYFVPRHIMDTFRKNSRLTVEVEVLDSAQQVLAVQNMTLGGGQYANIIQPPAYGDGPLTAFLAPRFNLYSKNVFIQSSINVSPQDKKVTLSLAENELRRATGVRCRITGE